jgi:hypothetical protein
VEALLTSLAEELAKEAMRRFRALPKVAWDDAPAAVRGCVRGMLAERYPERTDLDAIVDAGVVVEPLHIHDDAGRLDVRFDAMAMILEPLRARGDVLRRAFGDVFGQPSREHLRLSREDPDREEG